MEILQYGSEHRDQYIRLHRDEGREEEYVFVLIHGGFWKEKYTIDNAALESLAPFILSYSEINFAVAEVEYRRRESGGWPHTCNDMVAAVNLIKQRTSAKKIILLGHSAGGHGALFVAHHIPVDLCITVAPVADLVAAHDRKLSDEGDAVQRFILAAQDQKIVPDDAFLRPLLIAASPAHTMLPLRSPTLIVTGLDDVDVPPDLTRTFAIRAKEANANSIETPERKTLDIDFLQIPGADHYSLLHASSPHWKILWRAILDSLHP